MLRTLLEKVFKAPSVRDFTSIEALEKTGKPNQALMVPANWDIQDHAGPNLLPTHAPNYALSANLLFEEMERHFDTMPDCAPLYIEREYYKAAYCARSALMRYPDLVYIQAFEVEGEKETSSFAAYSHSLYGYSDLGVNTKRLEQLVQSLSKLH